MSRVLVVSRSHWLLGVLAVSAALLSASAAFAQPPSTEAKAVAPIDFAHEVLPLLRQKCGQCHTAGRNEGELSMDTREGILKSKAAVPGNSAKSEIIARVTSEDPDTRMPPKGKPLSKAEVDVLRRWIDADLPWQPGFTFALKKQALPLKLTVAALPEVHANRQHPVDRYADAYFDEQKSKFPNSVEDAAFYRRVSLDLVGLLPTEEQLKAFLADKSPNKRQQLVKTLLGKDQAYAEHWLAFWSDLLRNDYVGTGNHEGGRKQITNWLYKSLLANKPYDVFVRELISPSKDSEGFVHGITWRGKVNSSQTVEMQFAQNVGQVFLGINLKCASCHDSFIDNWKLTDSYGLAAVAAKKPLEIHRCDLPTGATATPSFPFPEIGTIDANAPREERLEKLAALITDRGNGWLPRTIVNRLWHRLMGRGIVHPVDAIAGEPWSPELLDYLANELVASNYNLKHVLELIATSSIYQAQCAPPPEASSEQFVFAGPVARRLTAEQFFDALWRMTDTMPKKTAVSFGDRNEEPVRASLVIADLLMRSLGRPNRDQVVTTRPDDLSTLQALDLTNGPEMTELVLEGSKNLQEKFSDKPAEQLIESIYVAGLCRTPTAEELAIGKEMVGESPTQESVADMLWCLLMLPEFQLIQ